MHPRISCNTHRAEKSMQNFKKTPAVKREDDAADSWSYSFHRRGSNQQSASRESTGTEPKCSQKAKDVGLEQQLTQKEKEMVAILSRSFISLQPHLKKILVKITQMNRCGSKDQHPQSCQICGITRIQLATLPQSYTFSRNKLKAQFKGLPEIAEVVLELPLPTEIQTSLIQINDFSSSSIEQSRSRKQFKIVKNVSLTYKPQNISLDSSRCRSANQLVFSKFRRATPEPLESQMSINDQTLLDELKGQSTGPTREANFTKINDLKSFVKKRHVEKQLLAVSTAANQKITGQYQNLKNLVNSQRLTLGAKIQESAKQLQKVKGQLQLEKSVKNQLQTKTEALEKKLRELREINERFLKQNNNLKEKVKQNMKIMQECRKYAKEAYIAYESSDNNRANSPKITQKFTQKSTEAEVQRPVPFVTTTSPIKSPQKVRKDYRVPAETQDHYFFNFVNQLNKQGLKPGQHRSTQILSRDLSPKYKDLPSKESSIKSQRTVGIRKNSPKFDPNSAQHKKNAQISNNSSNYDYQNDSNPVYSSKNERQNKSISNESILSSNLSQRAVHLQEPVSEQKRGILVDYMIQELSGTREGQGKLKKKVTKQDQTANSPSSGQQRERFMHRLSK